MELEKKSSSTAKAGLTTGIIGTALGALNSLGGLNLMTTGDEHTVSRYELEQQQKIAELEGKIALRDANTYGDQKMLEMYKYIDGRFREFEGLFTQQAVKNQANADSFAMTTERLNGLRSDMDTAIAQERHERKCADNTLVTYMNATFYPKEIASITTGTTVTPQNVYNPLPAECCSGGG